MTNNMRTFYRWLRATVVLFVLVPIVTFLATAGIPEVSPMYSVRDAFIVGFFILWAVLYIIERIIRFRYMDALDKEKRK